MNELSDMTILQILKKIKHLDRKVEKDEKRLAKWCSHFDCDLAEGEKPPYDTDVLLKAIEDRRYHRGILVHALHRANLNNTTNYKGKALTLDQLLILRTVTLPAQKATMQLMRRKEKNYNNLRHMSEEERKEVKVVVNFDPVARDKVIDVIDDDLAHIDQILDEINITVKVIV